MTVDVHTHVIPPQLVSAARGAGGLYGVEEEDGALVYPGGIRSPLTPDFYDVEALLARMERAGIVHSVVSLSPTLFFYGLSAADAVEFAREANGAMAEMAASSERLTALAQLPLQSPADAAEELERCVAELELRGALIGTNAGPIWLDDPRFEPIFGTAERLEVPLVLHPYFDAPKPGIEPFYLTNSIGNPLDTTISAARLVLSGVFDRHPGLSLVLVHGGGFLPYQLGRLDHAYEARADARGSAEAPPGAYLSRFWIDTVTHDDRALRFLGEALGSGRLVIGTDLPYDMADSDPVSRVRRAGLDPEELGRSALELFGVPHR